MEDKLNPVSQYETGTVINTVSHHSDPEYFLYTVYSQGQKRILSLSGSTTKKEIMQDFPVLLKVIR